MVMSDEKTKMKNKMNYEFSNFECHVMLQMAHEENDIPWYEIATIRTDYALSAQKGASVVQCY